MSSIVLSGDTSGTVTVTVPAVAGTNTVTIPAVTGNLTVMPTGYSLGAGNTSRFKNRIINGDMKIDQRYGGTSVTVTTANPVTLDRYYAFASQNSKYTVQQNAGSITPPVGFVNYLGVTSSSAYTVGSGDYFTIQQRIEGLNVGDLNWGTANAKTITLSFQVYSSLTGTFGGSLQNSATNRAYPFSYTISSANTWTQISVTIPGDTTGTWLTTNGIGVTVGFSLGMGSTYSAAAGSWAAGNYLGATGAVSVVGTSGATFYITGVQFEVGSTATSFEYVDYGTQLIMCQRYYQYGGAYSFVINANTYSSYSFGVRMRTAPTVTPTVFAGTPSGTQSDIAGFYFTNTATTSVPWIASAEL